MPCSLGIGFNREERSISIAARVMRLHYPVESLTSSWSQRMTLGTSGVERFRGENHHGFNSPTTLLPHLAFPQATLDSPAPYYRHIPVDVMYRRVFYFGSTTTWHRAGVPTEGWIGIPRLNPLVFVSLSSRHICCRAILPIVFCHFTTCVVCSVYVYIKVRSRQTRHQCCQREFRLSFIWRSCGTFSTACRTVGFL